MKNIAFFIPAIIFTVIYGLIVIGTGLSVSAMVFVMIALFIASGIFMSKKLFWGCLLGVFPGGYLIYMSTVDTGQIMNIELPLGIIIVGYYVICGGYLFVKYTKRSDQH